MARRVLVTGVSGVTPLDNDVQTTWEGLLEGRSGIDTISSFDASQFESQFAGELKGFDPQKYMDRKEIKRTDKFVHLAVAASAMALEDAGIQITDPEQQERF